MLNDEIKKIYNQLKKMTKKTLVNLADWQNSQPKS
jgi:hypothetical protein